MMELTIAAAVIFGCFATFLYAEPPDPILFAGKADPLMVVDGKNSEPCYANTKPTDDFKTVSGRKINISSRVRAVYDENKIYFFYDCDAPGIKDSLPADALELFINGTEKDRFLYYQVYAETNGKFIVNQRLSRVADPELLRKFDVKFQKKNQGYTCEIAVPRELFSNSPDLLWRVNFNRNRAKNGSERELSCWSATGAFFHTPERFGYMFLGDQKCFIQQHYRKLAEQKLKKINDSAKLHPGSVSTEELAQINQKFRDLEQYLKTDPEMDTAEKYLKELESFQDKIIQREVQKTLRKFEKTIPDETVKNFITGSGKEKCC